MKRSLVLLFAGVLSAAAVGLSRHALGEQERKAPLRDPTWIPSGQVLRTVSFGYRLVLSDLYWLNTVQYMGETVLSRQNRWAALYPLTDLVTDLDPRHGYAYQVAGSNLGGVAHRYDEAERILKKGIAALPDRWSLYWVHSVNNFLYEGDFAEAAEYARQAAVAGKRPHLALLAANLALGTDDPREYAVTRAFLAEAIQNADTPELKEDLERRLLKVRTFEVLRDVEHAIARYRHRYLLPPVTLESLVGEGLLAAVPEDPAGGPLRYDPATGAVSSFTFGARRPAGARADTEHR
jgi:hypothetical protein